MLWTLLFCLCSIWMASSQSILETPGAPKNSSVDLPLKDKPMETGLRNQGKHKTLFARRTLYEKQTLRMKPKVRPRPPRRRCHLGKESCFPRKHCCDPCASCHCRFFNTVCYCWRLGKRCQLKS